MWLSRSRVGSHALAATPQPAPYERVVRDVQGEDYTVEKEMTPQEAFQDLYNKHETLMKDLDKMNASIDELVKSVQALHDNNGGMRQDIATLDNKVNRVHDEIKRHEEHSDEEKHACRRRGERKSRCASTVRDFDSD